MPSIITAAQWNKGVHVTITPNAVWDLQNKCVGRYDGNEEGRYRPFATLSRFFKNEAEFQDWLIKQLEECYVVIYPTPQSGFLWPHTNGFLLRASTLQKNIW